jgi:hypothetical protein
MGRHKRPTRAQHARAKTLQTAAALGLAGAIPIVLQTTTGDNDPIQARSGVSSQLNEVPAVEPTAADVPARAGLAPTSSVEPRLLANHAEDDTRASRSEANTPNALGGTAPTAVPTPPAHPEEPDPVTSSTTDETPTSDAPPPTDQPAEEQPDDGGSQDKKLVDHVVDKLTGTVDGVVGGILSTGTGLLGR